MRMGLLSLPLNVSGAATASTLSLSKLARRHNTQQLRSGRQKRRKMEFLAELTCV